LEERDRRRHVENKRKRELNKILAFENEGLGVVETEPDDTAEARIKKEITREKP
jgi:hypothetical protein